MYIVYMDKLQKYTYLCYKMKHSAGLKGSMHVDKGWGSIPWNTAIGV